MTYRAFGFDIASDISLAELLPAPAANRPCVSIRLGRVEPFQPNVEGTQHYASRDCMLFSYDGVGRFRVSDGREIVVDRATNADERLLRVCLLGPVLAAVLHQKGLLVLHASAVAVNGAAVVFLGAKGWGKSTLAAYLRARGHDVLTDDVVVVAPSEASHFILPGFPQLKLWPEALEVLGLDPGALPRVQDRIEKRAYRFHSRFHEAPVPLGRVFVLDVGDQLTIGGLERRDAFTELVRHTYFVKYLEDSGARVTHFRQCAHLANAVPIDRIVRPPTLALLEETAAMVEAHVCGAMRSTGLANRLDLAWP